MSPVARAAPNFDGHNQNQNQNQNQQPSAPHHNNNSTTAGSGNINAPLNTSSIAALQALLPTVLQLHQIQQQQRELQMQHHQQQEGSSLPPFPMSPTNNSSQHNNQHNNQSLFNQQNNNQNNNTVAQNNQSTLNSLASLLNNAHFYPTRTQVQSGRSGLADVMELEPITVVRKGSRRKRRNAHELPLEDQWKCLCGKIYRKSSTVSIRGHRLNCILATNAAASLQPPTSLPPLDSNSMMTTGEMMLSTMSSGGLSQHQHPDQAAAAAAHTAVSQLADKVKAMEIESQAAPASLSASLTTSVPALF
jgi:hypothetical protein